MSSTTIDTTLPTSSSPAMDRYAEVGRDLIPFALYLHVELDEADIKDLLRICNSQLDDDSATSVQLAPNSKLYGQPLRVAYDQHVTEVAPAGALDPIHFVAVVDRDWRAKGVLLVALDSDEEVGSEDEEERTCIVDQMRVKPKSAGLYLVNLQIGNVTWTDYKEGEEWSGSDDE